MADGAIPSSEAAPRKLRVSATTAKTASWESWLRFIDRLNRTTLSLLHGLSSLQTCPILPCVALALRRLRPGKGTSHENPQARPNPRSLRHRPRLHGHEP